MRASFIALSSGSHGPLGRFASVRHRRQKGICALAAVVALAIPGVAQADGQLDSSFGDNGYVRVDDFGQISAVVDMAVYPTGPQVGKIVLSVERPGANGTKASVVRLNADGTPDTSFSGDGIMDLLDPSRAGPIDVRPDGGVDVIYREGSAVVASWLARLDSTGAQTGKSITALDGQFTKEVVQDIATYQTGGQAGKTLTAIRTTNSRTSSAPTTEVERFLATGNPNPEIDEDFGSFGFAPIRYAASTTDTPNTISLAAAPDGSVWAGGSSALGESGAIHLLADGSADPAFTPGTPAGSSFELVPGSGDELAFLALAPGTSTGPVLAGAARTEDAEDYLVGLGKLKGNGDVNSAFATEGPMSRPKTMTDFELDSSGRGTVLLDHDDGEVGVDFSLARYGADGNTDFKFGFNGVQVFSQVDETLEASQLEVADTTQLVAGLDTLVDGETSIIFLTKTKDFETPGNTCDFPRLDTPPTLKAAAKRGVSAPVGCSFDSRITLKLQVTTNDAKHFGLRSRTIGRGSVVQEGRALKTVVAELKGIAADKLSQFHGAVVYFKATVSGKRLADGAKAPDQVRFGQFSVGRP